MKIIRGIKKGMVFSPPKNLEVRPTTSFTKTGFFNIIAHQFDISTIKFLDLYCGTGNMSFEMSSRGCSKVIAIDNNTQNIKFAQSICLQNNFKITFIEQSVDTFLEHCNDKFDIVYADPPYNMLDLLALPNYLLSRNILSDNGLLIIEHNNHIKFSHNVHFKQCRKYGSSRLSFFG